jgi:hypothetical protein
MRDILLVWVDVKCKIKIVGESWVDRRGDAKSKFSHNTPHQRGVDVKSKSWVDRRGDVKSKSWVDRAEGGCRIKTLSQHPPKKRGDVKSKSADVHFSASKHQSTSHFLQDCNKTQTNNKVCSLFMSLGGRGCLIDYGFVAVVS